MAKLTRKQLAALRNVEAHLERALAYIGKPTTAVARKGGPATTTLHYSRADGSVLYEVSKEIGSDLTGLGAGLRELRSFLERETV